MLKGSGINLSEKGTVNIQRKGGNIRWHLPSFPLRGGEAYAEELCSCEIFPWRDGGTETHITYSLRGSGALLCVQLRELGGSEFIRLRYRLSGEDFFTGLDGIQTIDYGSFDAAFTALTEIQLSQFDRIRHCFVPTVETYLPEEAIDRSFIGPIVILHTDDHALLAAYEHGAEAPDNYLHFEMKGQSVHLLSTKGNFFGGEPVSQYVAPWIELGVSASLDTLLPEYRRFMLSEVSDNPETRKPYIFYNTWYHQEARCYFEGCKYLQDMNEDFILRDIDIAHKIGVEVYVIDTGWFGKTGEWEVNQDRFPGNMGAVTERLREYSMKLGLWFNPVVAAASSDMYHNYPEHVTSIDGKEAFWGKIWETEESYGMCIVSGYADMFIDKLVEIHEKLGVTYFKWDAIGQYGCNSPLHGHGNESNSAEERSSCYSYQMGLAMIHIAEELSRRCPGVIIDFDVTEGRRFFGLGFLSVGKYFLINNGPYFSDFDIDSSVKMEPNTINVFFYPGSARPQICRQGADFDFLIPSTLFLTHFLPHGSPLSRENSMASLALGGNGIWGELSEMSGDDIADWAEFINKYKLVRDAVTRSYPVTRGHIGSSPEIHEKLDHENAAGIVVFLTHSAGKMVHCTQKLQRAPARVVGADSYQLLDNGRLSIEVTLGRDEGRTVFLLPE